MCVLIPGPFYLIFLPFLLVPPFDPSVVGCMTTETFPATVFLLSFFLQTTPPRFLRPCVTSDDTRLCDTFLLFFSFSTPPFGKKFLSSETTVHLLFPYDPFVT